MAMFGKNKLRLDATSRAPTKYSDFTKGYRQSSNLIDQRDGQGEWRVAEGLMSSLEKLDRADQINRRRKGPTPIDRIDDTRTKRTGGGGGTQTGYGDESTPDDYSGGGIAEGGLKSGTTPSTSTRKASPEEAIERTYNARKR